VKSLSGKAKITQVACGSEHTLALAESERLYGWGGCGYGQLGLGPLSTEEVSKPSEIPFIRERGPGEGGYKAIAAGKWHSCAFAAGDRPVTVPDAGGSWSPLASCGEDTETLCYQWGWVHPMDDEKSKELWPVMVRGLLHLRLARLASGGFHNAVLTLDGELYLWGVNNEGQLGVGAPSCGSETPIRVSIVSPTTQLEKGPLRKACIVQVSLGDSHTACIDDQGGLYTWGNNEFGQCAHPILELGKIIPAPRYVSQPAASAMHIVSVGCGRCHTELIASGFRDGVLPGLSNLPPTIAEEHANALVPTPEGYRNCLENSQLLEEEEEDQDSSSAPHRVTYKRQQAHIEHAGPTAAAHFLPSPQDKLNNAQQPSTGRSRAFGGGGTGAAVPRQQQSLFIDGSRPLTSRSTKSNGLHPLDFPEIPAALASFTPREAISGLSRSAASPGRHAPIPPAQARQEVSRGGWKHRGSQSARGPGVKAQTAGVLRAAVTARAHSTQAGGASQLEKRELREGSQEKLRRVYRSRPTHSENEQGTQKEKTVERFRLRCREKVGVFVDQKKSIESKALSPTYHPKPISQSPSQSRELSSRGRGALGITKASTKGPAEHSLDELSSSLLGLATDAYDKKRSHRPETTRAERRFAADLREDRGLWLDQVIGPQINAASFRTPCLSP
jgi:hypothetical protein